MSTIGPLQGAAAAIQRGFGRLEDNARKTASEGATGPIAERAVERIRAVTEVKANVAVARTVDETIGSLLDRQA